MARNGTYGEGTTDFPNDTTFRTVMLEHPPSAASYSHRDDNFFIDEDTHTNISYRKAEDGSWVPSGEWVWTRERVR